MRRLGKGRLRFFRGHRGVGLIETLIAVALLGMIGVVFLGGLFTTSKGVMVNQEKVATESLAKSQMEHIKAQDYIPVADYDPVDLHFADVYGSVAGQQIIVNWSDIHYPAELRGRADLPGAGLKTISYSYK